MKEGEPFLEETEMEVERIFWGVPECGGREGEEDSSGTSGRTRKLEEIIMIWDRGGERANENIKKREEWRIRWTE